MINMTSALCNVWFAVYMVYDLYDLWGLAIIEAIILAIRKNVKEVFTKSCNIGYLRGYRHGL